MPYPTDEQIDTTFPDNTTGDIGADDMRVFQKQMTAAGLEQKVRVDNHDTDIATLYTENDTQDGRLDALDALNPGTYKIEVVSVMPGTPDANTIYFVVP